MLLRKDFQYDSLQKGCSNAFCVERVSNVDFCRNDALLKSCGEGISSGMLYGRDALMQSCVIRMSKAEFCTRDAFMQFCLEGISNAIFLAILCRNDFQCNYL